MKIFALPPGEDWVVDRFVSEWYQSQNDISTRDPREADILWLTAGWCWNHLPQQLLTNKMVICTIHHIDPDKFGPDQQRDFMFRDQFVDWYHVPCGNTAKQVAEYSVKPIFIQPFWVNQRIWEPRDKVECRDKWGIPQRAYAVGSFQRDTEGHDLKTPKLAKGPDIFCDVVEKLAKKKKNLMVVLAGWRRQYVIKRLEKAGIPYKYIERPGFDVINELYNTLDLYVVGSRHEGGPQAIFECAATQTPIISTPVGYAEDLLGEYDKGGAIFKIEEKGKPLAGLKSALRNIDVDANYERVMSLYRPQGMDPYIRFFRRALVEYKAKKT